VRPARLPRCSDADRTRTQPRTADRRLRGPPWGDDDPYAYCRWKRAWRRSWRRVPAELAIRRDDRAEALGLSYEEYTLEILERGRYLQAADADRIAAIKRRRLTTGD
jgi:hypothetical protein